jgi:hypothetical protein
LDHAFAVQHTCDVVSNCGHHLATSARGEISENKIYYCATNIGEGIAVEK